MTDIIEFDHGIRLSHGDCRDMLAGLPEGCADACVTDPPYEINFMNRAFDRTGIAFDPEFWRLVYRALKPGGHVLAFSASRTYHRMACAVEDAGFEIRDQIDWIYGSGMPHDSDAARLVDDRLGVERRVTGTYMTRGTGYRSGGGFGVSATNGGDAPREWDVTEATSDEAKRWDGWNTALKPAHEPIVLARKPLDGCLADNLKDHGCGALHVDACRVPFRGEDDRAKAVPGTVRVRDNKVYNRARPSPPYDADARFPPDVLLDPAAADVLDAQSGVTASRKGRPRASIKPGAGWGMTHTGSEYDDAGGASRFFPVFRYEAKAPSSERPQVDGVLHPTVKPVALMRWLVRLAVPRDGLVVEPFAGSGATLQACVMEGVRCEAAEMDADYIRLIRERMGRDMQTGLF